MGRIIAYFIWEKRIKIRVNSLYLRHPRYPSRLQKVSDSKAEDYFLRRFKNRCRRLDRLIRRS